MLVSATLAMCSKVEQPFHHIVLRSYQILHAMLRLFQPGKCASWQKVSVAICQKQIALLLRTTSFSFPTPNPEEVSRWEKQDYSHYLLPLFNYYCLCAFQQAPIPNLFLRSRAPACNCCCRSQSSEQTCLKYGLKWRSAAEANVSRLQTARRCWFSPRISQVFEAGISRAMQARSPESLF